MSAVLLLAIIAVLVTSKQIPCRTGQQQCKDSDSLTIVNRKYYCCGDGFNLQVTNQGSGHNSVSNCVCYKETDDIDCLEGQEECKNASNYILDGNTIKCCKNGYSMNSISNSFINGVRVEYCKCTGYNSNGGFSRPMTEAEREQFDKSMKQFNHQMQSSMHNLRQTLAKNLGSLKQNLANGFLQGLTVDLNNIDLPPEQ